MTPQSALGYITRRFVCPGARGGAVGSGTALQAGRSQVRFPMVSLELLTLILPAALWTWG